MDTVEGLKALIVDTNSSLASFRVPEKLPREETRKVLHGLKARQPRYTNNLIAIICGVSEGVVKQWISSKSSNLEMPGKKWFQIFDDFRANFGYRGGPATLFYHFLAGESVDHYERLAITEAEDFEIRERVKEEVRIIRE